MAQQYLNKKQELFCKFIAGGASQMEAYELAGYEPSSSNASTLYNKPIVQQRIAELKEEAERKEAEFRILAKQAQDADPAMAAEIAKGAEWNFQRIMDMMGENVRLAQVAGEYKAANECLKMMGEAMQMFVKAKGDETPVHGNLALIGQITNVLEDANKAQRRDPDPEDEGPVNPVRPRKG
jgi:hypothetical protein